MSWWRGSWRPMRDHRSARPPASPDARLNRAISGRRRNYGPMPTLALPISEVLVVADGWQTEPGAEDVIQRAIAAAAEIAGAETGDAELAVMLTEDAGIPPLKSN